jgi:putative membrane protein
LTDNRSDLAAPHFNIVLSPETIHHQSMNDLPAVWHPHSFGMAILATVVFGLVGIVLALIGFKLFDAITPFNLEKEMCENKNVAVGVLCGAIVLGVCIIVAAAII